MIDNRTLLKMICSMGHISPSVGQKLVRSYYMAERNSRQRGIEFALTERDVASLAVRSRGQCEVTGIQFQIVDTTRKWDRQPWTASIDRIDSTKGYAIDNCRLVCAAVNVALNAWGTTVLERIVDAMVELRLRQREGYIDDLRKFHVKLRRKNRRLRLVS